MIALIGMPGAGKSSVACALASIIGMPVHDSDAIIVERFGDILGSEPTPERWSAFRSREREVLLELAASATGVVAIGGGGWLDSEVRRRFADRWLTIHLDCDVATLVARLAGSGHVMFGTGNLLAEVEALARERCPDYAFADLKIVPSGATPEAIAHAIALYVRERKDDRGSH